MRALILALCLALWAQAALAADIKTFKKFCKGTKVPPELALAIARHESGLQPLRLNVEGKDYSPQNRAEAEKIINAAEKDKKSYDVGIMQINSQWIRLWKMDPTALLEPETNIRLGVRLLEDEIERHGLNWRAVAGYHSPNVLRGHQYAGKVMRQFKGNAELKSRLANPRLGNLSGRPFRFKKFNAAKLDHVGVLGPRHSLRKPVGVN